MSETRTAAADPTAGIPQIAGGAVGGAGPSPVDNTPLSVAESAQLAQLARGDAELGPMATAPAPAAPGGLAGAPTKDAVPPIPAGFKPVYDPFVIEQTISNRAAVGWPTSDLEDIAKRIRDGDMLYRNPDSGESRWLQMPGGVKSRAPALAGATAQATAAGTAAGTAPYDFVEVQRQGPGGKIETWRMPKDQAMQLFGAGGAPGAAPGAAPGVAPGAPGAPGTVGAGAPTSVPGAPVGMPVAQPGVADVNKRLQDLQTNADQAQQELNTVTNMRDIFNRGIQTGWGADTRAQLGRVLSQLGVDQDSIKNLTGIAPSDADAFQKQALRLSTEGVRTLGAREPGSIVSMFTRAYPSLETQPGALDVMTNILGQEQRRILDKRSAVLGAVSQPPAGGYGPLGIQGTQLQAEQQFDQQNPALNYLRSAYLMSGTDPTNKSDWYKQGWTPDMYSGNTLTPQGAAVLKLIPSGASFYDATGAVQRRR